MHRINAQAVIFIHELPAIHQWHCQIKKNKVRQKVWPFRFQRCKPIYCRKAVFAGINDRMIERSLNQ